MPLSRSLLKSIYIRIIRNHIRGASERHLLSLYAIVRQHFDQLTAEEKQRAIDLFHTHCRGWHNDYRVRQFYEMLLELTYD